MIRVAVVSDIVLYRDALARQLGSEQALEVAGTAGGWDEAMALVAGSGVQVALVDIAMVSAEPLVGALSRAAGQTVVVALGVAEEEDDVVRCIEAGAAGYVSREATFPQLISVIRSVSAGEIICSPRMAAVLARRLTSLAAHRPIVRAGTLSLREVEVARLVAMGLSNKEIAARLSIELATVKNHVHNILEKLAIERRAEVASQLPRRMPVRMSA